MAPEAALDPAETLGQIRARYLTDAGLDGPPRNIEWVKAGPIPIPVPNPPSRRAALRLHDLHHVLTGYSTTIRGEWQISGWEVGAGMHRNPVAWSFCLMGMSAGMALMPRKTARAYARGRRGRSLLDQDPEAVDALTLAEGHAFCRTDTPPPDLTAGDWARAIGWGLLGVFTSLLPPLAWGLSRFARAPVDRVQPAGAADAPDTPAPTPA